MPKPPEGLHVAAEDMLDLDVLVNPTSKSVIRGATIVPRGLMPLYGMDGGWSTWMWAQWPIESYIIPSMHHMVENGANAIAFKGGQKIYTDQNITWDEYVARWVDTVNYAKSIGLRCYVSFGNRGTYPGSSAHDWDNSVPHPTNASLMRDWAQALAETENVIGIDVLNEVWIWTTNDDELSLYMDSCGESGIPVAYDYQAGGQENLGATAWGPKVKERMDYICLHRYADVLPTDLDTFREQHPYLAADMRAMFSEYGANTSMTTQARQSRYQSMKDLIDADASLAGTFAFQWADSPNDPSGNQLGMHEVDFAYPGPPSFTPRSDVVDIWKTWPTSR